MRETRILIGPQGLTYKPSPRTIFSRIRHNTRTRATHIICTLAASWPGSSGHSMMINGSGGSGRERIACRNETSLMGWAYEATVCNGMAQVRFGSAANLETLDR